MFVDYDMARVSTIPFGDLHGPGIWPYADLLPIEDPAHFVSLGEGSTPLIGTPRLAKEIGLDRLFIEFDGANPTGTVKDRSTATAVGAALQFGFDRIGVVSTGNAGSSIASYAARGGYPRVCVLGRNNRQAQGGSNGGDNVGFLSVCGTL